MAASLVLTPSQLTFADASQSSQAAVVSNGTLPYSVSSGNAAVAQAQVQGSVVLVTPVAIGTTTITITDANSNTGTIAITVVSTQQSFEEVLVGYIGASSGVPASIIFNDLQIQEQNPGIQLNPQELGGVWADMREVQGTLWFTRNAAWSQSSLAWGFVNAANNAWGLALSATGVMTWYECVAGTSPFTWTAVYTVDALGEVSGAIGTTATTAANIAHQLTPTWNASGITMRARKVNVTDTASATASLLDDLQVGGVSKWSVRKDGTLTVGSVPTTQIPSGTFTGVYAFVPDATNHVPFTVSGITSQSADIFDVTLTSGGTKALFVTSDGATVANFSISSGGTISSNIVAGDVLSGRSATTGGYWFGNGASNFLLNCDGTNYNFYNAGASASQLQIIASTGTVISNGAVRAGAGYVGAAGDLSCARASATGYMYFGTGSAAAGSLDFGVTTVGKFSFQLDPASPSYAPVNGGLYTNASDASLKTNIAPIPAGSLAKIQQLAPSSFNWIHNGESEVGFVAQHVNEVFPEACSLDGNGLMGYAPSIILAHLVQAFNEYVAAHP